MIIDWKIEQIECRPKVDTLENVVSVIHWRIMGSEGSFNATNCGTVNLPLNEEAEFIDFASLSKEIVIGWVKDTLGAERVAELEQGLLNEINRLANPPVITVPLPWN